MAARKISYKDIMTLAEHYGVEKNAFFVSAAKRYLEQVEIISKMQAQVKQDGIMISHTNVKGVDNVDMHPLVSQIPKHTDTANKTLALMLDIVIKLGKEPEEVDVFAVD